MDLNPLMFLQPAVIKQVIAEVRMQRLMAGDEFWNGKKCFTIGVFDCTGPFDPSTSPALLPSGNLIYQEFVGDDTPERKGKISQNIERKCKLSWRTRMSLDMLHCHFSYLLRDGDIFWIGAEYLDGGIIVVISGLDENDDQTGAKSVGGALKEWCYDQVRKYKKENQGPSFILKEQRVI
jgi:hypothetical protein